MTSRSLSAAASVAAPNVLLSEPRNLDERTSGLESRDLSIYLSIFIYLYMCMYYKACIRDLFGLKGFRVWGVGSSRGQRVQDRRLPDYNFQGLGFRV